MKFTKEKTIIGLGILLVLLPLTGFPRSWKTVITVIVGIAVIYMGTLLYRLARRNIFEKNHTQVGAEIRTQTFTETI